MVLTPETKTFRDISQNLNEIPDLQREFDWKKENADRLFTDLWEFCDDYQGGDTYYFLGSMIVYREENQRKFQVVDGQQRLGSLCMMMCAFRDFLVERRKRRHSERVSDGEEGLEVGDVNPAFVDHSGVERGLVQTIQAIHNIMIHRDELIPFVTLKNKDNNRLKWLVMNKAGERHRNGNNRHVEAWNPNTLQFEMGRREQGWANQERGIRNYSNIRPDVGRGKQVIPVYSVYDAYIERLREQFQNQNDLGVVASTIWRTVDYIAEHVKVIRTTVTDLLTAFKIFETINDTGTPLSMLDIIRAHILSEASDINHEQNKATIEARIGTIADEEYLTRKELTAFTRRYWIGRQAIKMTNDRVRREILQHIKDLDDGEGEDGTALLEFTEELCTAIVHYRDLIHPHEQDESPYEEGHQNDLKHLNSVVESHLPFLLQLRIKGWLQPEDEPRVLRLIESAWIMHNLCLKGRWNEMDILYANLSSLRLGVAPIEDVDTLITNMVVKFDEELFRESGPLNEAFTADQFEQSFKLLQVHQTAQSNIILRQITKTLQAEGNEIRDRNQVEVEHILPKKPVDWWYDHGGYSQDEEADNYHKNYVYRLANQTLLGKPQNASAGNLSFPDKQGRYEESTVTMTNTLHNEDNENWGPQRVEARADSMANLALDIWPLITLIEEAIPDRIIDEEE